MKSKIPARPVKYRSSGNLNQDWIGLTLFKNFSEQDWIGFEYIQIRTVFGGPKNSPSAQRSSLLVIDCLVDARHGSINSADGEKPRVRSAASQGHSMNLGLGLTV